MGITAVTEVYRGQPGEDLRWSLKCDQDKWEREQLRGPFCPFLVSSCVSRFRVSLCSQVPVGMKWVIMHHVLGKNALRSGKTFHYSLAPTSERTKLRMKKTVVQGTHMATKLQIILSSLLWILGTRPRSSERTAALLTTEHLSQPPSLPFKIRLD